MQALDNLRGSIQESGADITHGELPTVRADRLQLTQLFQNLLSNALKFRTESPLKIHVDACREGDFWRFSVRDNGIGIDAKFRDRIFEIFRRLHTRESTVAPASAWRSARNRGTPRRAHLGGIGTKTGSHLLLYAPHLTHGRVCLIGGHSRTPRRSRATDHHSPLRPPPRSRAPDAETGRAELGVTKKRTRQIEARALSKLRQAALEEN